ncbi:MAG: inorganic pyrophosphatase [Spirochaetota bacterium]
MSDRRIEFVPHPWHGLSPGPKTPDVVDAFIEIIPTDTVKYEVDKESGYIRVDRPQKYSSHSPTLYGFIPRTYCGDKIAKFCMEKTGKQEVIGDGDPLDICVFASTPITHGSIIIPCKPIGGFRMIDKNEADDKIVAIMVDDPVYGKIEDIQECPEALINTLRHYFLTYKVMPEEEDQVVEITDTYGVVEAKQIISTSLEDYRDKFFPN